MSECPFEGMFFLELPFWVRHIPFWGVGGGGTLEVLKKIYSPCVIFKILGPPWESQHEFSRQGDHDIGGKFSIMLQTLYCGVRNVE